MHQILKNEHHTTTYVQWKWLKISNSNLMQIVKGMKEGVTSAQGEIKIEGGNEEFNKDEYVRK